jgi:hypothetical protein
LDCLIDERFVRLGTVIGRMENIVPFFSPEIFKISIHAYNECHSKISFMDIWDRCFCQSPAARESCGDGEGPSSVTQKV